MVRLGGLVSGLGSLLRDRRDGGGRDGTGRSNDGGRNGDIEIDTENLANVDVGTLDVDLGVLLVEESEVCLVSGGDILASITPGHDCEGE